MRRVAAIGLAVVALGAGAWYLLAPADAGAMVTVAAARLRGRGQQEHR